jgi:hypothetical protein
MPPLYEDDDAFYPAPTKFARPGSALRAASPRNPRNRPCPTCGRDNMLTLVDEGRGYQCDDCADAAERGR